MTRTDLAFEAAWRDTLLTLDELCRATGVDAHWVMQRVEEGLIGPPTGAPRTWRFDVVAMQRVRRMARIERDFDAAPELAALVADLADELEAMRARLARAGLE